jgi:hypothetical protein
MVDQDKDEVCRMSASCVVSPGVAAAGGGPAFALLRVVTLDHDAVDARGCHGPRLARPPARGRFICSRAP